jgi:hypothetical protein
MPSLKTAVEKELGKANAFGSGIEGATAVADALRVMPQNESDKKTKKLNMKRNCL